MLAFDQFLWDLSTFESYIEGMCEQVRAFPHEKVAFWAHTTPEVILTFFATWKSGKIACPLNTRLPSAENALKELETKLFEPKMPEPKTATSWDWDLNKIATLLYTSGSSGKPKIAAHTLGNHVYSALGSNQLIPLKPQDRWGLTLPLFHVGGLGILFRCYLEKCFVLLDNFERSTHLSLVPTQLQRILRENKQYPFLKTVLLGGAPVSHFETPWNVLASYGMTEMSSQIYTGRQIHPYAELKISDDQEILVRGKVLFQGYYEDHKISLPLTEEGWFATKDLGSWKDGSLQVLGRKDNLFISGGENIQPEEIEGVVRKLCDVNSVVVPITDHEFGERPVIFLEDPIDFDALRKKLLEYIPKYKIPIYAFPLPEQSGLKPNRKQLRKLAEELKQVYASST